MADTPSIYDVRFHDLVINSEASAKDNSTAIQTLVNTVLTAGGGRIYFPPGIWYFAINAATAVIKMGNTSTVVHANIIFSGDGPSSVLAWGGKAEHFEKHFFQLIGGCRNVTWEKLKFTQNRLIVDPDGDQHHCIDMRLSGSSRANIEDIIVRDCVFGTFKGDCVRLVGAHDVDGAHLGHPSSGANTFPGPITNPLEPQRVSVHFEQTDAPLTWDGGAVTVTGTDAEGDVISEVFTPIATIITSAYTLTGMKEFLTITGIAKATVGASACTVFVGYAYMVRGVHTLDCTFDGRDLLNATATYGYRVCVSVQRLASQVWVTGCRMRGSDDQLLDFEPTGEGDVGYFEITGNTLVHRGLTYAASLSGNGRRDPHRMSIFANNKIIGGKLIAVDLQGCTIENNKFYDDQLMTGPVITITKACFQVHIVKNTIVVPGTGAGVASASAAISIKRNGDTAEPSDIMIAGNIIEMPIEGSAIELEDVCHSVTIKDNIIRHMGPTANKYNGIGITMPATTGNTYNWIITNNQIEAAGTGTLLNGISISFGRCAVSNVVVTGNTTRNCSRGVRFENLSGAGTWADYPVVSGNGGFSCTIKISLDTLVYAVVGGNPGEITHTVGGKTAPETVVSAIQGSRHTSKNGDSTLEYFKSTGTGNTGWSASVVVP